jgi:hypothetical protein
MKKKMFCLGGRTLSPPFSASVLRATILIFLAALLSSCGPSHPLNAVRVQYEGSKWQDYYILQNRDTTIVAYSNVQRKDLSEVLPLEKMQRIAFQGKTTFGEVFGAIGGVFLISAFPIKSEKLVNIVMPASLVIGYCIGHFLTDRWIEVDPYSLEARELLESRSEYFDRK